MLSTLAFCPLSAGLKVLSQNCLTYPCYFSTVCVIFNYLLYYINNITLFLSITCQNLAFESGIFCLIPFYSQCLYSTFKGNGRNCIDKTDRWQKIKCLFETLRILNCLKYWATIEILKFGD